MSLSKTLQSKEILSEIQGKDFTYIKERCTEIGMAWFDENPDEAILIRENLKGLGLPVTEEVVQAIKQHIIYHYAEKILPLAGSPKDFADFIDANVDTEEAERLIAEAATKGGVLVATPHFGGVELVVPTIAKMKQKVNAVMRFSTPELSEKAQSYAKQMAAGGDFEEISFIEIGKPGVSSAMEMAAALRRSEVLFTVFDEETEHSATVDLFGKKVLGGAGLDKLLRFAGADVTLFTVFMTRTGDETFKMVLKPIDLSAENPVQQMFVTLEAALEKNLEQWYFLHEEVPFV